MILLALLAAASPPVPQKPLAALLSDSDKRAVIERVAAMGTVGFKVTVGANGRVSDCSVTRSSGFKVLDAETCKVVQRRARFAPARDEQGRAVAGVLFGEIVWDAQSEDDLRQ